MTRDSNRLLYFDAKKKKWKEFRFSVPVDISHIIQRAWLMAFYRRIPVRVYRNGELIWEYLSEQLPEDDGFDGLLAIKVGD